MTNVGLRFREWLSGSLQVVQDELDQVIAGIQGTWAIEHNTDGTHGAITSTTLQTSTINLTGGQIAFPVAQQPSANSNTLDDYEEGNWTPIIGGEGGTSGQTYTTQRGRYVKVGRVVHFWSTNTFSSKGTITGNAQLQGLPYAMDTNMAGAFPVVFAALATNWVEMNAAAVPGGSTTALYFRGATAAAAANNTNVVTADIGNTSVFECAGSYLAAQ